MQTLGMKRMTENAKRMLNKTVKERRRNTWSTCASCPRQKWHLRNILCGPSIPLCYVLSLNSKC